MGAYPKPNHNIAILYAYSAPPNAYPDGIYRFSVMHLLKMKKGIPRILQPQAVSCPCFALNFGRKLSK
jgi:hypothetical protein